MDQAWRMSSASNDWEADPWDAPDEIADVQHAGFQQRALKPLTWEPIDRAGPKLFGIDIKVLRSAEVAFFATYDGEEMLLMRYCWHGFPDPPEWGLATRPSGKSGTWNSWGFFAVLPARWEVQLHR